MANISSEAINELIKDFFSSIENFQFTSMDELDSKVVLVDDSYSPVSRDDLLAIAKDNPLNVPPGTLKTQLTDCDDYALQLKAIAMANCRQRHITDSGQPLPPAIAIVISQNHAVNLFVEQDSEGNNSLCFLDASTPGFPMGSEPEQAEQIMKQPPLKLIYM